MTTRNLLSLVFVSLMIFSACSKDNNVGNPGGTPNDPNTYKPGNTLLIDDLVLYTSDGAHRDANMIKDFLTRNFPTNVYRFNLGQSSVTDHKINQSLLFLENNQVKLNGTIMEIVSKTATELILSPLDSTKMPDPGNQGIGRCILLKDQVPQFNPYSICNTAGGNCKKYRKQYPVIISGKDYYIPLLNYAVVSTTCGIYTYTSSPMPNYLNPQISNGLLQNNDSVLVQVTRLPMSK
jgi:hypothetical protein